MKSRLHVYIFLLILALPIRAFGSWTTLTGKPMNTANQFSWSAYTGFTVSQYVLYKYNNGVWNKFDSVGGTYLTYTDTGLHCNLTYFYKVQAFNSSGAKSGMSDSIKLMPFDTIKPPPPVVKYASIVNGSTIQLFWNKSIPKVKYYEVWMRTGAKSSFKKYSTLTNLYTTSITSLNTTDSTYSFKLIGADSCSNRSAYGSMHTPIHLVGKVQNSNAILTWSGYVGFSKVSKYYIYRLKTKWSVIDSVSGDSIHYTDAGLTCGTSQYYKIAGIDNTGQFLTFSDSVQIIFGDTVKSVFTINNSSQCLTGNSFSFTDKSSTSSGTIKSWAWDFGDTYVSTSQSPTHSYSVVGTYSVQLTVTNSNGCANLFTANVTVNPKPVSSFLINIATQCLSANSFSFLDKSTVSSGSIASWAWDFGDTYTSGSQNPSHSFAGAGTYTIKLTASSKNGCSDISTKTVTVYPQPAASFTINTASQCQSGNSFVLTDNSTIISGTVSSWLWDFGDGKTAALQNPSYSYIKSGNYSIKLIVVSSNGCKDSATKSINVSPQPVAAFNLNSFAQCFSNKFLITDKSSIASGSLAGWHWDFGDGDSANNQSPTYNYSAAGSFKINLKVTSDQGCTDTISQKVTVYPIPSANPGKIFTLCQMDSGIIGSISVSGNSYSWTSKPAGFSSTNSNPSVSPTINSIYYLTETITATGCSKTDSVTITVNPLPGAKTIADGKICSGQSISIGNASVSGNNYIWTSSPSGFSSTVSNPTISPNSNTTYYLTETITATGCSKTDSVTITVNPKPTSGFTFTNVCLGDSSQFTNKSTSATSYSWTFGDGKTSTVTNPKHLYAGNSTYTVTLKASNSFGCSDSSSQKLILSPCVWPGDANNDKTVDMKDFLAIGFAYGTKGHPRSSASTAWTRQVSPDWDSSFASGVNYKHADCNGDSIIDYNDTLAIIANYGKSHPKSSALVQGSPGDPSFSIHYTQNTFFAGDTLKAIISLGNVKNPVSNLYGLKFSIVANPLLFQADKAFLTLNSSFLGTPKTELLGLRINDIANSATDIGLTRITHTNISGYGNVATLHIPINSKLPGEYNKTALNISDNLQISINEKAVPMYFTSDSVLIKQDKTGMKILPKDELSGLKIFPNPFSTSTTIQYHLGKSSQINISICDVTGKQIVLITNEKQTPGDYSTDINAEKYHLEPGMYLLKFEADRQVISKQLLKF